MVKLSMVLSDNLCSWIQIHLCLTTNCMLLTIMSMLNSYSAAAGSQETGLGRKKKKITEGESGKEISEKTVNGHVCKFKKNVNFLFSGQ